MCALCKEWKTGNVTAQGMYAKITEVIENTTDSKKIEHLMQLSDIILDELLPVTESNPDAEEAFWKATHRGDDEG